MMDLSIIVTTKHTVLVNFNHPLIYREITKCVNRRTVQHVMNVNLTTSLHQHDGYSIMCPCNAMRWRSNAPHNMMNLSIMTVYLTASLYTTHTKWSPSTTVNLMNLSIKSIQIIKPCGYLHPTTTVNLSII